MAKLFELNQRDTFDINSINFNVLALSDMKMINDIYHRTSYVDMVFENSFAYLYSLQMQVKGNKRKPGLVLWKIIGKHLMIFLYCGTTKKIDLVCQPVCVDGNYSDSIVNDTITAIKIMKRVNVKKESSLFAIQKCLYDSIFDKDSIDLVGGETFNNSFEDFIFDVNGLINLEGRPYRNRRRLISQFHRDFDSLNPLVRAATPDDYDGIIKCRNAWMKNHTAVVFDKDAVPITLRESGNLGLRVFVAIVDSNIEGFIVISKFARDAMITMIQNTNKEFRGLSDYLFNESLKECTDLGKFTNDGNGGARDSGIYNYKMSFNPITTIERSGCRMNAKGSTIMKSIFKEGVL